jgi:hypothetical protein
MNDVQQLEILGTPPSDTEERAVRWFASHLSRWLAAGLALALAAVAALGTWVYLDHRDTRSDEDRALVAAATAFVTASNAHDVGALMKTLTPTGRMVFLGPDGVVDGPYVGNALGSAAQGSMDGFHETLLADPVVLPQHRVEMAVHVVRTGEERHDVLVFDLQRVDGLWKIAMVEVV